jgi:cold shock protein
VPARTVHLGNDQMEGIIATGRVSWFDPAKRFGFVKLDDDLGDAFLHIDALKAGGYYFVPRGTTVRVRVEPDRGKHRVVEMLLIDTATAREGESPPLVRKQSGA